MKYYKTQPWIVSYKYQEKLRDSMRDFFFLAATQIAPVYARITPSSFLAVISTCPFGDEATLSIKTTVLLIEKKKEAESIQTRTM